MNEARLSFSEVPPLQRPSFGEAIRFWLKLGFISFGGPAGQIAIMHAELVEKRRWIDEGRFLHALNYCMLLPGPEAQQLAIYIGWLLHRTWGGVVAGVLFVLPSAFLLWGLSLIYVLHGQQPWVAAIFYGLKPAVLAIVAAAALRLGRRTLRNRLLFGVALGAFVALAVARVPFPAVILAAVLLGWLSGTGRLGKELAAKISGQNAHAELPVESVPQNHFSPALHPLRRAVKLCAVGLALWWTPVLLLGWTLGWQHTLAREAIFFSKAALVTFGGAYAVLPYVAQQAVEQYQWLSAEQMMDGLGLAETTPGPLIMVLQFVGFVGAWHQPGTLRPFFAATLGAMITTWTTFVPCFLWIFLGAPHLDRLRNHPKLSAALNAVTAAVVGVILNLTLWFAQAAVLPNGLGLDWFVLVLAVVIFTGLTRKKWNVMAVVLGAGTAGVVWRIVFP